MRNSDSGSIKSEDAYPIGAYDLYPQFTYNSIPGRLYSFKCENDQHVLNDIVGFFFVTIITNKEENLKQIYFIFLD